MESLRGKPMKNNTLLQPPPRALRAYLGTWYVLGAAAAFFTASRLSGIAWAVLAGYLGLALALNAKTVRRQNQSSQGAANVSLSSIASFAAIAGLHPLAGVVVEAAGALADNVFPRVRPLYQTAFNISVCCVGATAAGLTYAACGGPRLPFLVPTDIHALGEAAAPMLAATFVYFIINASAVATVVSIASGTPLREVWARNFSTTFIGYAAGGVCALFALALSGHMPPLILVVLIAPILYTCYSREQTDEARVVALEKGKDRLHGLYMAAIRTLAHTVAAKDPYTSGHIHRVTAYSMAIGRHIGCSEEELTDLETGALLHDIGKIGVPEHILTKPGRLDEIEMAAMRRHPEIGWNILGPLDFPDVVKQIVRNHHERVDGRGYPDGLTGDELPLLVRIVCVADVFDALTSARPYRGPLSVAQARAIMREDSGSHFDPAILASFFEVLDTVPWEDLCAAQAESPVLSELLHATPVRPPSTRTEPEIRPLTRA